jgi:hypothetical protein
MGVRFWVFAGLMTVDVVLAAAFLHHLYGLLFLLAAIWFAVMAAQEANEQPKSKP